ncbi:polyphosphate glucokinase [Geothermobacter hydrogeniphilus]|uniref:Polyphosphate glucokinase n=1 Tax=Geothermobacter hydrogeniphilus TaxID=1969733 RepID=A0A2K2H9Y8_9BACT|nr:ROK family protein [Geothermobacter hydrogeniphilus]PNU20087.1 polyphosphate glucokinase [Geothermobacter hydrogeniphilus]
MEIFGIDIGGTGIKAAPVDVARGRLLCERRRLPTPQPATPPAVARAVTELVRIFSWSGPIGCGFPAVVRNGVAFSAANIDRSWVGADAGALLSEATGCPVRLINDADAAGLAEMRFGAGRGVGGTVIMVTIGTGLGSALFRNGELLPNSELGHLYLADGTMAEHFASARVRKAEGLSWQQWAGRFSLHLQQLERLLNPDLFILGGGGSKKHTEFIDLLKVETPVRVARYFNDAGIVGAALAGCPQALQGGAADGIIQA